MRVAVFNTKSYDRIFLEAANEGAGHELIFYEPHLTRETAVLARDFPAVCAFVNDTLDAPVLAALADYGVRLIALRAAGFNNVDLAAAEKHDLAIVRVPGYSPTAVAEHTVALLLTLNRKIHRAHNRVREGNFSLEGLLGFDIYGETAGIIGTGKIGIEVARILRGFGCRLIAFDPYPNPAAKQYGVEYVPLDTLLAESDIITLHAPLTPQTYHVIDDTAVAQMKPGVVLLNTSRGALVETQAVVDGLKSGHIGYLGLDVYEEEADLFFEDLSNQVIQDDLFSRLLTFPNVVITGHQAFFTRKALRAIADTTIGNITAFEQGAPLANAVTLDKVSG